MDQDRHVERPVPGARQQVASLRAALAVLVAVVAVLVSACGSSSAPRDPNGVPPPPTATSGAIVQLDSGARTLYALSDIHGGYDRMVALLVGNGLARAAPSSPEKIAWAAGDAVLVVAGDLIDKGPQPVEVIDALHALETSAAAAGGKVFVLLGNHEAEFFVDPTNSKADGSDGIDHELDDLHIERNSLFSASDPRGSWLLARPFGARVGGWFFSHGGSTHGRTVAELDALLRSELTAHPTFDSPEIVGGGSILEERDWYGDEAVAPANARALGVGHIVFGHTPNALGDRGAIATAQNDVLLRIDCGMSPVVNDSDGCLLRVRREAGLDVAEELRANGAARELFRAPKVF